MNKSNVITCLCLLVFTGNTPAGTVIVTSGGSSSVSSSSSSVSVSGNSSASSNNVTVANGVVIVNGVVVSGGARDALQGSGRVVPKNYALSAPVQSIVADGTISYTYNPDVGNKIVVMADDNVHEHMQVSVHQGLLKIEFKISTVIVSNPIQVYWGGPSPTRINSSGVASCSLQNIQSKKLKVNISGAGGVTASGRVTDADISISGSAQFDGADLTVENLDVNLSGVGAVSARVTESVTGQISGVASVNVKGNPTIRSVAVSGAGRVNYADAGLPDFVNGGSKK